MSTKGRRNRGRGGLGSDHDDDDDDDDDADEGRRYDAAEAWCRTVVKTGHALLFDPETFHDEMCAASLELRVPLESLHSLLRNVHLLHVKKSSYVLRNDASKRHLRDYTNGKSMLDIARGINYPPYMVARFITENIATIFGSSSEGQNVRKAITEAMRDPVGMLGGPDAVRREYRASESAAAAARARGGVRRRQQSSGGESDDDEESGAPTPRTCPFSGLDLVDDDHNSRLSREVVDAINSDPLYGPRHDRDRHSIGLEYEIVLEQTLLSMNIPFETEAQLRVKGTARTPDILLSCPVGVRVPKPKRRQRSALSKSRTDKEEGDNTVDVEDEDEYEWKVVCWIDSKALFGDVQTHNTSVLPQAETYVHRFGPGVVLYWFGHAPLERLGDGHGDVVVMGWNVPDEFRLPTEQIVKRGSNPIGRRHRKPSDSIDTS